MISSAALIEKFQYALDNHWGYIWGTAGILWTKAKQKQKVDYMVSKYGTSWQKNSEAKEDTYYRAAMYGDKWIDHHVADCSGLFRWAFNEYKLYIAHGSNTIWKSYCTAQGSLSGGKRTDGKNLKPGTAVFTDRNGDKTHIGLFIGGGKVIEAANTDAGVCMSNVSASKWKCWGELKNISYESDSGFPDESAWHSTVRRGSKGDDVKYVQTMLYKLGYDLGSYGIDGDFGRQTEAAVKEFQRDHKLNADGVVGPLTYEALEKAVASLEPVKEKSYTVCIRGLDKTQAEALKNNYPGATISEE
ncbi:MAG: peptidoglycan-binding protein [Clostridia bacterium]|nr:peptidoglycan-binding protein [Clostridia bacterium]